jgi:hypothetical protein
MIETTVPQGVESRPRRREGGLMLTPLNRQGAKDAKASPSAAPAGAAGAAASPVLCTLRPRDRPLNAWRVPGGAAPLATLARGAKKSSLATLASWRFNASEDVGSDAL